MNKYIEISDEVKLAISQNKGIVALESTIVAHGMPWPKNFETAQEVENVVREYGAVPATIAIMKGKLKVGLSNNELEMIAKSESVLKVSRRDIPYAIAKQKLGATTVSATMIIAEMAGIKIFVTGGIGGVHRNFDKTLDISADLSELGKTDVNVICAGVKSILDIGNTLEYLETLGVPVIAYQTDEFPAFYCRESGFKVEFNMDTPKEIAELLRVKSELGLSGGAVIGNPVSEKYSMDKKLMDSVIDEALMEAKKTGVVGKKITPFLLDKIKTITQGKSLETNIALVLNNAKLGAQIAVSL